MQIFEFVGTFFQRFFLFLKIFPFFLGGGKSSTLIGRARGSAKTDNFGFFTQRELLKQKSDGKKVREMVVRVGPGQQVASNWRLHPSARRSLRPVADQSHNGKIFRVRILGLFVLSFCSF